MENRKIKLWNQFPLLFEPASKIYGKKKKVFHVKKNEHSILSHIQ